MVKERTLDIPRLFKVLEPTLMAYHMSGVSFRHVLGHTTCKFYTSNPDMQCSKIIIALRSGLKNYGVILSVGYNRLAFEPDYTRIEECSSYKDIPDLFCKMVELWKQGK